MNGVLISSTRTLTFSKRLCNNIENLFVVTEQGESHQHDLIDILNRTDVVIAVIDEFFIDNNELLNSLEIAHNIMEQNDNKPVIVIALNGINITKYTKKGIYLNCNSHSFNSLQHTKMSISNVVNNIQTRKMEMVQRKRLNKRYMFFSMLAIEVFALLFVLSTRHNVIEYSENEKIVLLLTVMTALFAMVACFITILREKNNDMFNDELETYSIRLEEAFSNNGIKDNKKKNFKPIEKKQDALELMRINLEDIKAFYTWSQKQAKASFALAVTMSLLGFVLIIITIFFPKLVGAKFTSKLLVTIGGVIVELVAGTALVVYKDAINQLNYYHRSLHEDERFLSSVNLVSKLSSQEEQDKMLKEIIECEIKMNMYELSQIGHKDLINTKTSSE